MNLARRYAYFREHRYSRKGALTALLPWRLRIAWAALRDRPVVNRIHVAGYVTVNGEALIGKSFFEGCPLPHKKKATHPPLLRFER